jgi:uncharacterized small protein (DUF1192 family)
MREGSEGIELHPHFWRCMGGRGWLKSRVRGRTLFAGRRCDNHGNPQYGWLERMSRSKERHMDEDVPIRKKVLHQIGQDLSTLSVEELSERIKLLQEEIVRLDAARSSKRASRTSADQIFKKGPNQG